jgi:hypothetical protein
MDDGNLRIFACNLRRALRAPEECDIPWMLEKAAREIDRLRIVAGTADELERLRVEVEQLRTARDEVHRQAELVAEYGGPRCGILCPPRLGCGSCSREHWCLLSDGHDGGHIFRCEVERLRAPTPREFSPYPINSR